MFLFVDLQKGEVVFSCVDERASLMLISVLFCKIISFRDQPKQDVAP